MSYNPNLFQTPTIARASSSAIVNNTGFTIFRSTPVKETTGGGMAMINPSIEADIEALIGLVQNDTANGLTGEVINSGVLSNISTSANFGDPIWLSKLGYLTNVGPEIGVGGFIAGDWIVLLGTIEKNSINPTQKDLLVKLEVVGQL